MTMGRGSLYALPLALVLIVVMLAVLVFKTNPEVASRLTQQQLERRLHSNCLNDLKFRRQYKQRAEVERHFLGLYVRENKALLDVATAAHLQHLVFVLKTADGTARALIGTIHIIPLPSCERTT